MEIDTIDDLETFKALRENFESVYFVDTKAQFFISWVWLSRVLSHYDQNQEPWEILAAKPDVSSTTYVAFFPLKLELVEHKNFFYTQLLLAGTTDANHLPFICLPDYEMEVVSAFASYLCQRQTWSVLRLANVQPSDDRLRQFLSHFSNSQFELQEHRHISDLDTVDNNIVPIVTLPTDWETYLQTQISSNSRQRIKRFLRKVEDSDEYCISETDSSTLELHLELLRQFWESAWEGRKGADTCRRLFDYIAVSLRHFFEHDCLYLPVLWKQDQPLGAIANVLDKSKKTVLFIAAGRNTTVTDIPSGIVLHAHSIRYAIQHGFQLYNFLMGNEAYKYSFGAQEHSIRTVILKRQTFINSMQPLDEKVLPYAIQIASAHHRANRLADAETRYRQILYTQPDHADTLYGLGVVLHRQEKFLDAETTLRSLLEIHPNHTKAKFSLATVYQTQGLLEDAEVAYKQALATPPETSALAMAIYHNLGFTLQQQAKWDEAIACYEKARALQPDNLEVAAIWANAMYLQGKLSPTECAYYAGICQELGDRRQHADDRKVAIEYYRQAIALNPDLGTAHANLGKVLQSMGAWDEAIECFQRALALQPDNLAAAANLASVRHHQGTLTPEEQLQYAAHCLDVGDRANQAQDLDNAIHFYQQAIALQPDLVAAHSQLGMIFEDLHEWEEALACYQTVLNLQPTNRDADVRMATALHALSRLPSEQQAHYAALNFDLGNLRRQTGELEQAIDHYHRAIALNPALLDAREQLRLALQEQHNIHIKVSHTKR